MRRNAFSLVTFLMGAYFGVHFIVVLGIMPRLIEGNEQSLSTNQSIIFIALGSVILLFFSYLYSRSLKRTLQIRKLKKTGSKITCHFAGISSVGDRKIIIKARRIKTSINSNTLYKSDKLLVDLITLSQLKSLSKKTKVTVYVDNVNPDIYFVDFNSITLKSVPLRGPIKTFRSAINHMHDHYKNNKK